LLSTQKRKAFNAAKRNTLKTIEFIRKLKDR
jgi:hypothetical protein